jgi:hypothetical protein
MGLTHFALRVGPDVPVTCERLIAEDSGVSDVDPEGPSSGCVGVIGALAVIETGSRRKH